MKAIKIENLTKEEKMECIIEDIINCFKREVISLPRDNNSEFNIECTMSKAIKYLFVLFSYLEKNLKKPQHYSIDFHYYFNILGEKLELMKDFEQNKIEVFGEIGEYNE